MDSPQAPPPTITDVPAAPPELSGKKLKFARAWQSNPVLTLAARAAGAKRGQEAVFAEKMFNDRDVHAYLIYQQTLGQTDLRIPRWKIRDGLSTLAFSNPMDAAILDDKGQITGVDFRKIAGPDVKKFKVLPGRNKGDPSGVEVEFHPKIEPQRLLGQDAGMYTDEGKPMPVVRVIFGNLKNSPVQVNVAVKP